MMYFDQGMCLPIHTAWLVKKSRTTGGSSLNPCYKWSMCKVPWSNRDKQA